MNRFIKNCLIREVSEGKAHTLYVAAKGDVEYFFTGQKGMMSTAVFLSMKMNLMSGEVVTYGFPSLDVYLIHLEAITLKGFSTPGFLKATANLDSDEIVRIFEEQDAEALLKLPGLGGKIGRAMIERMFKEPPPEKETKQVQSAEDKDLEDGITDALSTLGHKKLPARKTAKRIMLANPEVKTLDELVTLSLRK